MSQTLGLLTRTLLVIYRITVNFTDLPYGPQLRDPNSEEFRSTSESIAAGLEELFAGVEGNQDVTVVKYR